LSFKTKVDGLSVVWPQNHWDNFLQFDLKTIGMIFSSLASKSAVMVFSGLASKPAATVFSDLASKPMVTVSPSLAPKLMTQVFRFGPQNRYLRFSNLCLKITTTAS
jgi:hypothetical protein